MKQLSESEYHATFGQPMKRLASDVAPPFDFWDYFESIPLSHFEGHDCSAGSVTYVWENPAGQFQHVLVDSVDKNTFMVLVGRVLHEVMIETMFTIAIFSGLALIW